MYQYINNIQYQISISTELVSEHCISAYLVIACIYTVSYIHGRQKTDYF